MRNKIETDEITQVGEFSLYDRVKIKDTNITGNIVNFNDYKTCEVEYDKEYDKEDIVVYTHNINDLEHE